MLIGNAGRDPEVRYLDGNGAQGGSNSKVATFTLATTERFKDRSGNLQENTEWHNIVSFRNADFCERFVRKGTQLFIEGRIRTREYTDQTGTKKYRTEIVADNIQLLGRRSDNPAAQDSGYQGAPTYQAPAGGYAQAPGGFAPASAGFAPASGGFAPASAGFAPASQAAPSAAPASPATPAADFAQADPAAPTAAPAPGPIALDLNADSPSDDLPF